MPVLVRLAAQPEPPDYDPAGGAIDSAAPRLQEELRQLAVPLLCLMTQPGNIERTRGALKQAGALPVLLDLLREEVRRQSPLLRCVKKRGIDTEGIIDVSVLLCIAVPTSVCGFYRLLHGFQGIDGQQAWQHNALEALANWLAEDPYDVQKELCSPSALSRFVVLFRDKLTTRTTFVGCLLLTL